MKLILQHGSNIDVRGGYWETPVDPKLTAQTVTTIAEGRAAFVAWRERNHLGGGNMTKRSGELWQDAKTLLGRFSYNGRFWNPDGTEYVATKVFADSTPDPVDSLLG